MSIEIQTGLLLFASLQELMSFQITKRQVDEFVPGRLVPSCQLYAKLTGQQEQSVELVHRVELLGAKEPFNFFLIRPPSLPSLLTTQSMCSYHDLQWCADF